MAIDNITRANTFGQWLSTTQSLVAVANALTDGPTFTANTVLSLTHSGETLNVANTAVFTGNVAITGSGWGLNVSNSVYVGGDLLVGGNVTLDAIGFDDLTVSGNASIVGSTTIGGDTALGGLLTVDDTATFNGVVAITGSGWGLNVSNSVYVGGNLLVGGTVTLDAIGFNDLSVAGNAAITGNETIGGTLSVTGISTVTNVFFSTAFANTGSIQVYDATVLNTATVNILSGNSVNQFDPAGTGVAMAIALG